MASAKRMIMNPQSEGPHLHRPIHSFVVMDILRYIVTWVSNLVSLIVELMQGDKLVKTRTDACGVFRPLIAHPTSLTNISDGEAIDSPKLGVCKPVCEYL